MSTSDNPFNTAAVPGGMVHNIGMEISDQSQVSRNVLASPANPGRPAYPAISQPRTSLNEPSPTVAQSKPHRAWEEGYLSPFAPVSHHPSSALRTNAQPGQFVYNSVLQPQTFGFSPGDSFIVESVDKSVQRAPTLPANTPNFPLPVDGPSDSPHFQRTSVYRQRRRKAVTKEITLDNEDVAAMVTLRLSPFMVGQDMIANQNRFVRNECILARHFLRLERDTLNADDHHSKIENELRSYLQQQKSILDTLAGGSGPTTSASSNIGPIDPQTRADADFLELKKAHQEISAKLEALSLQVTQSSQSTQRALTELAERLDQIIHTGAGYSRGGSPAATTSLSLHLSSITPSNLKRKETSSADSIMESPTTMPPTPDYRNHD